MSDQEPISTERLVGRWQTRLAVVARLEKELESVRAAVRSDEQAVVRRIIPSDASPDEMFCVWVRFGRSEERLVVVTGVMANGERRARPREGSRATEKSS